MHPSQSIAVMAVSHAAFQVCLEERGSGLAEPRFPYTIQLTVKGVKLEASYSYSLSLKLEEL